MPTKSGPDFIIIGAMKCMTSTVHEQLAAQDSVFMTTPKEPCYFSDDAVFAKGSDWYASLFSAARPHQLCGESSTHYTKLPTYPHAAERLHKALPNVKLIYIMRHPIERLRSQYMHDWSQRQINCSIDDAIQRRPELIEYGRYSYQLEPFLRLFGPDAILPVFCRRIVCDPQSEIERIGHFLGSHTPLVWDQKIGVSNESSERMRRSEWRDKLVYAPGVSWVRKNVVPQSIRNQVKRLWQLKQRPQPKNGSAQRLREVFDKDLFQLGRWLGTELTCDSFREVTSSQVLNWRAGLQSEFPGVCLSQEPAAG